MTWWEWLLLGFAIWALLVTLLCVMNYRFWNLVQPVQTSFGMLIPFVEHHDVACLCRKGAITPGCRRHDPQARKSA